MNYLAELSRVSEYIKTAILRHSLLGADVMTVKEGSITKLPTTDDEVRMITSDILKELKIMNLHLSLMTDSFITKQEVE